MLLVYVLNQRPMLSKLYIGALLALQFTGLICTCNDSIFLKINNNSEISVHTARALAPGTIIDQPVVFYVPTSSISGTEFMNYAEGFNGSHAIIALGFGSLFNHAKIPNVRKDFHSKTCIYIYSCIFIRHCSMRACFCDI